MDNKLKTAESLDMIASCGGGGLRLAPRARFQRLSLRKRLSARLLAFTLAEVLIVIGIIGIVADMTIPTLMQSYQKQVTVTRLKKVYSVLNQAYKMGQIENGAIEFPNNIKNQEIFDTYFKPFLSGVRECNSATTCGYASDAPWVQMNGEDWSWFKISESGQKPFYLKDGTFVLFWYSNNEANATSFTLSVDINGPKKPNKIGYDYFYFTIYSEKNDIFLPAGYYKGIDNINNFCNKNSTSTNGAGVRCAAKIMRDGWKITYDW